MNLSSLELSIVILTVFAVVAVLVYNAWNARPRGSTPGGRQASAPERERAFRDEPVLSEIGELDSAPEPTLTPEVQAEPSDVPSGPMLDPRVECVVTLRLLRPTPGERLLAAAQTFRRAGTKPVHCDASTVRDEGSAPHSWEMPRADRMYPFARVGVLLANRNGALNGVDFSEFLTGLEGFAQQFEASYEKPDMAEALARARELDAFCAAQDAQLMVHVETPDALGVDDLSAVAIAAGLHERGPQRWVALASDGATLFSVSLGDRPNRMSMLLDLPRVPVADDPWGAMIAFARLAAGRTQGRLVDDGGQALGAGQLEAIQAQLDQRAATLRAADIEPGSLIAQRLFN